MSVGIEVLGGASGGVLGLLASKVSRGELRSDATQERAARRLEVLRGRLESSARGRRFGVPGFRRVATPAPGGVYMWGEVGRGKTMLMDMLCAATPEALWRRRHFDEFMREFHERLNKRRREEPRERDPIPAVVRDLRREARMWCLDEFQVRDVADASILTRAAVRLFEEGATLVATSNTPPWRLYEGGLNRERFLPAIAEMEERMEVLELTGREDHRAATLGALRRWRYPADEKAHEALEAAFSSLAGDSAGSMELKVGTRILPVGSAGGGCARFTFEELCSQALGSADYAAVARTFRVVMLEGIPLMPASKRNEARRFITLVDALYDAGVRLAATAAAAPEDLCVEGSEAESFRRCASRLREMTAGLRVAFKTAPYEWSRPSGRIRR